MSNVITRAVGRYRRIPTLLLAAMVAVILVASGWGKARRFLRRMSRPPAPVVVPAPLVTVPPPVPPAIPDPPTPHVLAPPARGCASAQTAALMGEPLVSGAEMWTSSTLMAIDGSPRACVIAVQAGSSEVMISRDEGRSFRAGLDSDSPITSIAVDDAGTVFVVRRDLGVQDRDGHELWRPLPSGISTVRAMSGWLIAPLYSQGVALSDDQGATWRFLDAPDGLNTGADTAQVTVSSNGTIWILAPMGTETFAVARGRTDGTSLAITWAFPNGAQMQLEPDGFVYRSGDNYLLIHSPSGKDLTRDVEKLILTRGYAISGGTIFALRAGALDPVANLQEHDHVTDVIVDSHGAFLTLTADGLFRHAVGGDRLLLGQIDHNNGE